MRSLAAILLTLTVLTPAFAKEAFREISTSFALESETSVRLDIPLAEVSVEGFEGDNIEVDFTATCRRPASQHCDEILAELGFESHRLRRQVRIDLVGYPKWGKGKVELEGTIRVPQAIEVEMEIGIGQLDLKELTGDLRVELGVGQVNAWLDESKVRSVTLDAGVGESELYGPDARVQGRRSMLVGSEIYWDEGSGKSRVFIEVGVGEISVWLE
jgi:hypothetical protein